MSTVIEELDPIVEEPVTVTFKLEPDDREISYTQEPLSFFGKMELFSVLGGAVEKALSEEGGISLSEIMEVPQREDGLPLSTNDFLDADTFIKSIAKLVQFAPDLIKDLFCISLRVPRGERPYVKELMEEQITDDEGFELIEKFIDQNLEVMKSFFSERILPLVDKISQTVQGSAPQKPSKRTQARTPKK